MNAFEKHKLRENDYYYSKILKIYNPDNKTLEFIINKCKKDKTIIYTKNYYLGEVYFITKLLKNNYNEYKNRKQQYNFKHYEENVLNSSNNNLITPKMSSPRYFNELPNTLLEKEKWMMIILKFQKN